MSDTNAPRAVIIGSSGVGKTAMVSRVSSGHFDKWTTPTIGAAVTPLNFKVNGTPTVFHVWDTAGQEIFRNVVPLYFRGATVAILVFSFTDLESFNDLPSWLQAIRENCPESTPVIVAGNKIDAEKKIVDLAKGREWARQHNFPFFQTSAVTGENINQLFELVASYCSVSKSFTTKRVELTNEDKKNEGGCLC